MTYLSHILIKVLIILLNEEINGFIRIFFFFFFLYCFYLGFYCFYDCCCCCLVLVVVVSLLLLLFCWFRYFIIIILFFIIFVLIHCGVVRHYFLRLLGIPITHVRGIWRPFYILSYS